MHNAIIIPSRLLTNFNVILVAYDKKTEAAEKKVTYFVNDGVKKSARSEAFKGGHLRSLVRTLDDANPIEAAFGW
jgi:hypothetical protein